MILSVIVVVNATNGEYKEIRIEYSPSGEIISIKEFIPGGKVSDSHFPPYLLIHMDEESWNVRFTPKSGPSSFLFSSNVPWGYYCGWNKCLKGGQIIGVICLDHEDTEKLHHHINRYGAFLNDTWEWKTRPKSEKRKALR